MSFLKSLKVHQSNMGERLGVYGLKPWIWNDWTEYVTCLRARQHLTWLHRAWLLVRDEFPMIAPWYHAKPLARDRVSWRLVVNIIKGISLQSLKDKKCYENPWIMDDIIPNSVKSWTEGQRKSYSRLLRFWSARLMVSFMQYFFRPFSSISSCDSLCSYSVPLRFLIPWKIPFNNQYLILRSHLRYGHFFRWKDSAATEPGTGTEVSRQFRA